LSSLIDGRSSGGASFSVGRWDTTRRSVRTRGIRAGPSPRAQRNSLDLQAQVLDVSEHLFFVGHVLANSLHEIFAPRDRIHDGIRGDKRQLPEQAGDEPRDALVLSPNPIVLLGVQIAVVLRLQDAVLGATMLRDTDQTVLQGAQLCQPDLARREVFPRRQRQRFFKSLRQPQDLQMLFPKVFGVFARFHGRSFPLFRGWHGNPRPAVTCITRPCEGQWGWLQEGRNASSRPGLAG